MNLPDNEDVRSVASSLLGRRSAFWWCTESSAICFSWGNI